MDVLLFVTRLEERPVERARSAAGRKSTVPRRGN